VRLPCSEIIFKNPWEMRMVLEGRPLTIAVLSIHSSPVGKLGTKDTGGMSVYIRELARVLGRRGHRVDIFTRLQDPGADGKIQLYDNVRLIHLRAGTEGPMPTSGIYPYLGDFFREVERFRTSEEAHYDLIHSHYWLSGRVGECLEQHWKSPHLVMFHTLGALKNISAHDEQESELRIATEENLVRHCQRILTATAREKKHLVRHYGARPEKISVVPCGVNLDLFRPMDKATARRQLGIADAEAMVLFVGRLSPIKGIDRLLQATTHLKLDKSLRLVIIGGDDHDTPESRSLERLSRELGIQDAVDFLGRVEQEKLSPYYSAADVVVLPSHYETFGLVALEALACGTPVVATRVGAMEALLKEGETGHIVANGAPQLLAAGIEQFTANSAAAKLPADAIRRSVLKFGWDRVATAVMDEYATLLRQYHGTGGPGESAKFSLADTSRR
jgi:D-inositol-3-phosphate glycosyltransferase